MSSQAFMMLCSASLCVVRGLLPYTFAALVAGVVTMAFLEDDANVRVDVASRTLWLSQIFSWFSKDFGEDSNTVATTVCGWLRGDKKAALEELLQRGTRKVGLKYFPYDWSTNSARSLCFGDADTETESSSCSIM
jgi:hypothetical protein